MNKELFTTHNLKMSSSGLITVPAKWRKHLDLSQGLIVNKKYCREKYYPALDIWPSQSFQKHLDRFGDDFTDHSRQIRRFFVSSATQVTLDSRGRVLINEFLREYAHLESDVVCIEYHDHLEICDLKIWNEIMSGS